MAALRILSSAGRAFRKVIVWTSADEADVATSPTITAASGAPTSTEPNGSLYMRTDGTTADDTLYARIGGSWVAMDGAP